MNESCYLNPHQARDREPDDYQNLLGDAIERSFAAGDSNFGFVENITHPRQDKLDRQVASGAHQADQQRAASGEAFGGRGEHRWPHVANAGAPHCRRQ